MKLAVERESHGQFVFDATVIDNATGEIVAHPHVTTPAGVPATLTTDTTPKFKIELRGEDDGTATATMQVYDAAGNLLETSAMKSVSKTEKSSSNKISINLKDADLKDVIQKFAAIANLEPRIKNDVQGRVTVELHNVPWDEALQRILSDNGYEYAIEGNTLIVRRTQ